MRRIKLFGIKMFKKFFLKFQKVNQSRGLVHLIKKKLALVPAGF